MFGFFRTTSAGMEAFGSDNSKSLINIKRKLTTYGKHDDLRFTQGSSMESLPTSTLGSRLRKISGNVSDNSSNSNKEIRYYSAQEEKNVGDDRMVFVSTDHKVHKKRDNVSKATVSSQPHSVPGPLCSIIRHHLHQISESDYQQVCLLTIMFKSSLK